MHPLSHKLLISRIENEVKLVIFTREYFSHSHQGLFCTKNAPCLTLNNSLIWYAIEMGVSQNESLIFFLQIRYQAFVFSISLEEIIDEKLSTLRNGNLVHSKKHYLIKFVPSPTSFTSLLPPSRLPYGLSPPLKVICEKW